MKPSHTPMRGGYIGRVLRERRPGGPLTTLRDAASIVFDATAVEILLALSVEPRRVTPIAEELDLDKASVSRRLAHLVQLGFAVCTCQGKSHFYALGPNARVHTDHPVRLVLLTDDGGSLTAALNHSLAAALRRVIMRNDAVVALGVNTAPVRRSPGGATSSSRHPNGRG